MAQCSGFPSCDEGALSRATLIKKPLKHTVQIASDERSNSTTREFGNVVEKAKMTKGVWPKKPAAGVAWGEVLEPAAFKRKQSKPGGWFSLLLPAIST